MAKKKNADQERAEAFAKRLAGKAVKGSSQDAYVEGSRSAENRQHESKNPHPAGSPQHMNWHRGHQDASAGRKVGKEGKKPKQ